jgi:hypothetical protein
MEQGSGGLNMDGKILAFCRKLEAIAGSQNLNESDQKTIGRAAEMIRTMGELIDTYEELNAELKEDNYRLEERIGMMIDR